MSPAFCPQCKAPVIIDPEISLGSVSLCESCLDEITHSRTIPPRDPFERDRSWRALCPERYHDTDPLLLPHTERSARALAFQPRAGIGLNLWGVPDTGKTRTLLLVLKACHAQGLKVRFIEAWQFPALCEQHAYQTGDLARRLSRVDVLALDDMDKLSLTRHQEKLFFGIIDSRMSHRRPTLFTHNSTAHGLEYTFRACGESLVRRLRQFCQSIHFPAQTKNPSLSENLKLGL